MKTAMACWASLLTGGLLLAGPAPARSPAAFALTAAETAPAQGDSVLTDRIRRQLLGKWAWIVEENGLRATTISEFFPDGHKTYEQVEEIPAKNLRVVTGSSSGFYRIDALDETSFTLTYWSDQTKPTPQVYRFADPDTYTIDGTTLVFKRLK